jgi:hypothetical protein
MLLAPSGDAEFAPGLGPNVDRTTLQAIADASGGQASFPATVEHLAVEYARVVEDLRRRYVLSYASTDGTRDGSWRHVELTSAQPVAFRSRGGYRAPER